VPEIDTKPIILQSNSDLLKYTLLLSVFFLVVERSMGRKATEEGVQIQSINDLQML